MHTPERLRQWRKDMGLSRAETARRLGVSYRAVQHWEGGTREPPEYLWRALRDLERELAMERRD